MGDVPQEFGLVELIAEGQSQSCLGERFKVGTDVLSRLVQKLIQALRWCRGTESNCRHQPFQGCALPTELPRHGMGRDGTVTGLIVKNQV